MVITKRWVCVGVLVIAAVALSVAASALVVDEETTTLTGLKSVKSVTCHAVVDLAGGIYTYTYDLTYNEGAVIHIYRVQNPNLRSFFDALNVPLGETDEFTNPLNGSASWVSWTNGDLTQGQSRSFSYKSYYKPQEIEVWCWVVDGGDNATGKTIGMSAYIPEPGSLVVVSLGIIGLIPVVRRHRV